LAWSAWLQNHLIDCIIQALELWFWINNVVKLLKRGYGKNNNISILQSEAKMWNIKYPSEALLEINNLKLRWDLFYKCWSFAKWKFTHIWPKMAILCPNSVISDDTGQIIHSNATLYLNPSTEHLKPCNLILVIKSHSTQHTQAAWSIKDVHYSLFKRKKGVTDICQLVHEEIFYRSLYDHCVNTQILY